MTFILPVLAALLVSFPSNNPPLLQYVQKISFKNNSSHKVTVINIKSGKVVTVSQQAANHSPVFVPCNDCFDEKKISPTPWSGPTVTPLPTVIPTEFPLPIITPVITIIPEPTEPMPIDPPPCRWKWDGSHIDYIMKPGIVEMPCPILDNEAI